MASVICVTIQHPVKDIKIMNGKLAFRTDFNVFHGTGKEWAGGIAVKYFTKRVDKMGNRCYNVTRFNKFVTNLEFG